MMPVSCSTHRVQRYNGWVTPLVKSTSVVIFWAQKMKPLPEHAPHNAYCYTNSCRGQRSRRFLNTPHISHPGQRCIVNDDFQELTKRRLVKRRNEVKPRNLNEPACSLATFCAVNMRWPRRVLLLSTALLSCVRPSLLLGMTRKWVGAWDGGGGWWGAKQ